MGDNGITLAMENWRYPASHAVKKAAIKRLCDGVPDHLWFAIGGIVRLDVKPIADQFFQNRTPDPGDIIVHASMIVLGEMVLCIHKADVLAMEVNIKGKQYPLYQAGCNNGHYVRFCSD